MSDNLGRGNLEDSRKLLGSFIKVVNMSWGRRGDWLTELGEVISRARGAAYKLCSRTEAFVSYHLCVITWVEMGFSMIELFIFSHHCSCKQPLIYRPFSNSNKYSFIGFPGCTLASWLIWLVIGFLCGMCSHACLICLGKVYHTTASYPNISPLLNDNIWWICLYTASHQTGFWSTDYRNQAQ